MNEANHLAEAICALSHSIKEATEQRKLEFSWIRSLGELATKQDLKELIMKVSELKGEVAGLRQQVVKVFAEQQAKYDTLKAQFDALEKQLADQELDPEVAQSLTDFKAQLQAFDDQIPDTTA